MSPSRPTVSLRARAVAWLAQRDHSEAELRAKLLRLQQQGDGTGGRVGAGGIDAEAPRDGDVSRDLAAPRDMDVPRETDAGREVDETIAWLRVRGYLDDRRFVQSRVAARQAGRGLARIRHELGRHGLNLPDEDAAQLRGSEFERAFALWQRRFGTAASGPREAARQARFLAGRGFGGDTVRRVLRHAGTADEGALSDADPDADGAEQRPGPSAD